MFSFELADKMAELLRRIQPLELWKLTKEWGSYWDDNRPSMVMWVLDCNHPATANAKAKIVELIPKLKSPYSMSVHDDVRELRNAVMDFNSTSPPETGLEEKAVTDLDTQQLSDFQNKYDKFLKEQNLAQALLLSEAASRLYWWFHPMALRMSLTEKLLKPAATLVEGESDIKWMFSDDMNVAEISDLLERLNRLYEILCGILQRPKEGLRVKKIETGTVGVWVFGIGVVVKLLEILVLRFRPALTNATKMDNEAQKLAYVQDLQDTIVGMEGQGFDMSRARELLVENVEIMLTDAAAIRSKNPNVWMRDKWVQWNATEARRSLPKPPDRKQLPQE